MSDFRTSRDISRKRAGFILLVLAFLAVLALVLSVAMIGPAQADSAPKCQPLVVAQAETAAEAKVLGGKVIVLIDVAAGKYLAIVNAVPPVTHLEAKMIMILVVPDQGAVIGLVAGENVCIAGHIGAAVHKRALEAAQGNDT